MEKRYHFIGIGGIGMSALVLILLKKGQKVTGSDIRDSATISHLREKGVEITIGHFEKNLKKPDIVVYSSDIPADNPEYIYAKQEGFILFHRSQLLSQLMKGYVPLLVTGTHGKTTTSSLLAHTLLEAGLDPSFAIGGYLKGPNSNGYAGNGMYFVAEADESDGTFLEYPSFGAILTNLEQDHMNYWKTEQALLNGFYEFAMKIGSKNHLFWCQDDMRLRSLNLPGFSYGFDKKSHLVIENFAQIQWKMVFDISFEGKRYHNLEIPLIGAHNVLNASAVFGLGLKLDVDPKVLRQGLRTFQGVGRRVEKKGSVAQVEIYDDYAHHPTEIFATLRALRTATHGKRLIVAFQPHRYTRTQHCLDDFAEAFLYADQVILTNIYAAMEKPIPELTEEKVLERIKERGYHSIQFIKRDQLIEYLSNYLQPGDVLITMGAGDITMVGPAVLKKLTS